jgi:hypothetical protein
MSDQFWRVSCRIQQQPASGTGYREIGYNARQPDRLAGQLPCGGEVDRRGPVFPDEFDRERGRSESNGNTVAGEWWNVRQPVADAINCRLITMVQVPPSRTNHGDRLVPQRLGTDKLLGKFGGLGR